MDFHQNTQPESNSDNQDIIDITPSGSNSYNSNPYDTSAQNINNVSSQEQQAYSNYSYGNTAQNMSNIPQQTQQPNGNDVQPQSPYQVQHPYGSDGRYPYQNDANAPYQNGNPYHGNTNAAPNNNEYSNGYNNSGNNYNNNNNNYSNNRPDDNNYRSSGYNNYNNNNYNSSNYNNYYNNNNNSYNYNNNNSSYSGYNRGAYGMPVSEPGSGLATAAMILGIVSIISCFTFTVYPAFITGSIAIVLAILSKGRRSKLLSKAKTGITCAVIGLISNTVLIISFTVMFFTVPEVRAQVNQTCVEQYGKTFDEMLEEILENSGYDD